MCAMCRVSPECNQSIMFAMIGTRDVTGKQPIRTSLLNRPSDCNLLSILNPPHFLKDILHIFSILYITSVPDVERGNVQLR